jgi:hypothetical protein
MRVPGCAIWVLIAVCSACGESRDDEEQLPAATCNRAKPPADLDPRNVSWQLIVPPQGDTQQRRWQPDALIDTCEQIVSLAHDRGPYTGGKTTFSGPSQVVVTSTGESWSSSEIVGIEGATFFDIAPGRTGWVAVGRSATGDGVIAYADALDLPTWRQVFTAQEWAFENVAYGAGVFAAQSRFGVAVSRDGKNWSWASVPGGAQYMDVAFGNGRFVVAGVGATISSTDGKTWERMRCPDRAACPSPGPGSSDVDPLTQPIALQQVAFVRDTFYLFGGSGALQSRDGKTLQQVKVNIPDAAIGGVLVSMAEDVEHHWAYTDRITDPPQVFISKDEGQNWVGLPLTVSSDSVDCSIETCVIVPQGILVLRKKEKPVAAAPAELCDGTEAIRLMYTASAGFGNITLSFTAPYGTAFFAIDGTCRYYAQANPASPIVTGTLTPEEASRVSADLAWDKLSSWGNYYPKSQCPDAGGVSLGIRDVFLTCGPLLDGSCGCDSLAPDGLPAALKSAIQWWSTLTNNGTPLTGAMRAIVRSGGDVNRPWQPWPLARAIPSIPGLIVDQNMLTYMRGPYPLFDDPAETALLRALRASQPEAARTAGYDFSVRDGDDAYSVYLRDELPDADANRLQDLTRTWTVE